jgi:heterodisulfide reductase subunit D
MRVPAARWALVEGDMSYPELKALESEIATCFRCSLCKMVPLPVFKKKEFSNICPINTHYGFHGYSASGMGYMALALAEGRITADRALADIVFSCRTCGYCDMACKFIMESERNEVNMALREVLVKEGLAPEEYRRAVQNMKETGNAAGVAGAGEWARGLDIKKLPEQKAEVLIYAGCRARDDGNARMAARKLAMLLLHAGVDAGILGDDELCCGLPAHWTGFRDDFREHAEKNRRVIAATGVKKIVTVCGACLGTLKAKYPKHGTGIGIEVVHATELLARLVEKKKIRLKRHVVLKATYHDPCYLGRQSEPHAEWKGVEKTIFGQMKYYDPPKKIRYGTGGIFDPPRALLKKIPGLDFREMYRIREYSHCCGGGGGQSAAYDGMALRAARDRVAEARAVGAECLVTACSHCKAQFEKAGAGANGESVRIADIIDLVFQAADIE